MATLNDEGVRNLLQNPNYAVVTTLNADGTPHSTIVWVSGEDGTVAVNSAIGRVWPSNLERDPRINVLVFEAGNPYHFVEIRGTARPDRDRGDEHIDRLARKYTGKDRYPYRQPGEERIKFVVEPDHVRHVKQ